MRVAPMPLSHRRLAAWYTQLAQQLEAGLTLRDALQAPAGSLVVQRLTAVMAARIEGGGSVDDALQLAERFVPQGDLLTLSAAAMAGRMPQVLRSLAERHARLGAAKLRVALACLYPLAIIHVGVLLIPVTRMINWESGFQWSTAAYLRGAAALLVPLWMALALVYLLARRQSPVLRRILGVLPGTRGYLRAQALADLCFALGNFLGAGVPIGDAWAGAGLITRSSQLKTAADAMAAVVDRGQPPGAHLAAWPCFPPEFAAQYRTAETTGQLDVALLRLSDEYQNGANRALTLATLIYPALAFMVVAGGVVYAVLTFYAGYLKMVVEMSK